MRIPVVASVVAASVCMTALAFEPKVPRPLADVTVEAAKGGNVRLRDYRGKILLVALINTECSSCAEAITTLNAIHRDYESRGVQIVAAAVNDGAVSLLPGFYQRYRPAFPLGVLNRDATRRLADFTTDDRPFVPIFVFADKSGTVRAQAFGDSEFFKNTNGETRRTLEAMLAE